MKKTLFCLAIGILSFYVGIFVQSLFYWERVKINIPPVEDEFCSLKFFPYESNENVQAEIEYSTTPNGAYFPNTEMELDTALILSLFDDSKPADVKIENKIFRSENPIINEKGVSFKTIKSKQNIEYRFEGNFIQNPFKNEIDDGKVNLIGTLTKQQNGKVIYKIKTKYTLASEVCAWKDIEFEQAN